MSTKDYNSPSRHHPRDEPIDPEKKAKRPWQMWLSGSPVLLISILLHVLFIVIAGFFIVQRFQEKRKQNFSEVTVTMSSPAAAAAKHQSVVTEKKNTMSTPEIVHNITVSDFSTVTLPEVSLPVESGPSGNSKLEGTSVNGAGLSTGNGLGIGTNSGAISMDTTLIASTIFGLPNAKGLGLVGEFYDLKQTADLQPTDINGTGALDRYYAKLGEFVEHGFNKNFLQKYYKAPKTLYLPYLCTSYIRSVEAPEAYGVSDTVQPSLWCALYKGYFTVPESGTFRFVAFADNVLQVRVNGRMVVAQGFQGFGPNAEQRDNPLNRPAANIYNYTIKDPNLPDPMKFKFSCGSWMQLEAEKVNKIEILIGDDGGACGYWLMVEDKEKVGTYAKSPEGSPILPLFQVSNVKLPSPNDNSPPYDNSTSLHWTLTDAPEDDAGSSDSSQ